MNRWLIQRGKLVVAIASLGAVYQIPGCNGTVNFLRNLNPCGSVLACDPVNYRFLTSGYEGPGIDVNIDPACTFPPFCGNDPFVNFGGEGG